MANRRLSPSELDSANSFPFLRASLEQLSAGDPALLWALRRKVDKELTYDERGKPDPRG